MPDGGDLYITFDIESIDGNDYGVWKIKDSGIGIDEDNLSKIFDPFYTTKEPGEGTGLGLSISYGICKEAGGSLEAQSTVNHGTEFAIRLPLCKKN